MKYSYWAVCPKCKTRFHVYGSDKKPEHTGVIDGIFGVIEECVFCLGIVERLDPVDPATGTGAFLANPPFGDKGGTQ